MTGLIVFFLSFTEFSEQEIMKKRHIDKNASKSCEWVTLSSQTSLLFFMALIANIVYAIHNYLMNKLFLEG